MYDLLKSGFNSSQIARIQSFVDSLKTINIKDLKQVNIAQTEWNAIVNMAYSTGKLDMNKQRDVYLKNFNMMTMQCTWSGNYYPAPLLVFIPNGKGSYAFAGLLLQGDFEWEYSESGNIVRQSKLYGDRNILGYSTDPLQYLKFKCLPYEKLTANLTQDPEGDEEYSGNAPVFLGIELEVERKSSTPKHIEHMIANDLGMDYMILKSDSSVPEGFEIVTAPATIGYHLKAWDKFFENSAKYLKSWDSGKCGMHVHISRKAFTPMHLGKLTAFLNNIDNRNFVTTIAGRNSTYAKFNEDRSFHIKSSLVSLITNLKDQLAKTKNAKEIASLEAQISAAKSRISTSTDTTRFLSEIERGGERHTALNLAKKNTVEIRIFRGNVSKIGMLKNIEFAHAAVEFTREATFRTKPLNEEEKAERILKRKENTDYALHYTFFLDWLQKDTTGNYNNLKQWLQTHKLTDKFTKRKVSDKTPPDKRVTDDDVRAVA